MDRTNSNQTSIDTYTQHSVDHTVDRPLDTTQSISADSLEPSIRTNLSMRAIFRIDHPIQQLAVQRIPPSPKTKPEIAPPDPCKPVASGSHHKTQSANEYTRLWQQIAKTKVLENFITSRLFTNRIKSLLTQLNKLALSGDEQLEILTNYYLIKFADEEQPNAAIQNYRNDRKSIECYLNLSGRSIQSTLSLFPILDQVETCIKDSFDIKRHLTTLSQSHYSLSINDCEHGELDEYNTNIQKEYQKEPELTPDMRISSSFSRDLFRGMNISIHSPSGNLLIGIYVNANICLFIKYKETGEILEHMKFNTNNLNNPIELETFKRKFIAQIETELDKLLPSPDLTKIITFLCSQRPANAIHNLLNLYLIGNNLFLSLPEREIRTEIQIHHNNETSVKTKLSVSKYIIVDNRSGTASKFDIDQVIRVTALCLIPPDNQQPPHFHNVDIEMLKPVSIQFNSDLANQQ